MTGVPGAFLIDIDFEVCRRGGGRPSETRPRRDPRRPRLLTETETEVEQDGKRFVLRSPPRPAASLALRVAGVALPPTVRQLPAA